jgi:D-glucosaminate-6-phosphate ammonia-lyase
MKSNPGLTMKNNPINEPKRLVNACGPWTIYGAAIARPEAIAAAAEVLKRPILISDLHAAASAAISRHLGSEAGFITNCSAAAVTVSVAACMAGGDPSRVEQLPDTSGMKNEVVVQKGHDCNYGAPITQAVRLAGAKCIEIGRATGCGEHHLRSALNERTAAALFIVNTGQSGMLDLETFVAECHAANVPVIVDAAAAIDPRRYLRAGADLVAVSVHKCMRGLTAGLIAGRADLVRACFVHEIGIGRTMKAGKEAIAGAIAALEQWVLESIPELYERHRTRLAGLIPSLEGISGIHWHWAVEPDGYGATVLKLRVLPESGWTAHGLMQALAAQEPCIVVNPSSISEGIMGLDPSAATDEEFVHVGKRIAALLRSTRPHGGAARIPTYEDFNVATKRPW